MQCEQRINSLQLVLPQNYVRSSTKSLGRTSLVMLGGLKNWFSFRFSSSSLPFANCDCNCCRLMRHRKLLDANISIFEMCFARRANIGRSPITKSPSSECNHAPMGAVCYNHLEDNERLPIRPKENKSNCDACNDSNYTFD